MDDATKKRAREFVSELAELCKKHSLWPYQNDDTGIVIVDPRGSDHCMVGTFFGNLVTHPSIGALSLRVTDLGVGFNTFGTMISDHTSVEET